MTTTTRITTASGAVWLIHGGEHITRLAEHPMHSHSGRPRLGEVVETEAIVELAPLELGKPLRVRIGRGPITTTAITKIEWSEEEL